jgi:hypothetical protein
VLEAGEADDQHLRGEADGGDRANHTCDAAALAQTRECD